MVKEENKLNYGIKGKLISAIAMLLVAVIMVVSSTYAWFTLSTAPEVRGIQTAVGANGALEMLLLTVDENGNFVYRDGIIDSNYDSNTYWGNIVDLSNGYGLDQIVLYPSVLNGTLGTHGYETFGTTMLKTPVYGADGRVSEVNANTVTGLFDATTSTFVPGNGFGVRGVGTSSGMTERQLAYRNALSAAATAMSQAKNLATASLSTNGSALADIAIKRGLNSTATYTQDEIASLIAITDALLGDNGVIASIETAYKQYIIAYAASAAVDPTDKEAEDYAEKQAAAENLYTVVQGLFNAEGATLYSVVGSLSDNGVTVPLAFTDNINELKATKDKVATAASELADLTGESIEWASLSTPLNRLVSVDNIKVNGMTVNEVKDDTNALLGKYMADGGLIVSMASNGGVYADIADHCGDYTANVRIKEVSYGTSLSLQNVPARMETESTVETTYLVIIYNVVNGAGAPATSTTTNKPISEFYGYVIDLAFRTNAAESNLLLQQNATDRIYSDNKENDATWGNGSTMTFKATTTDFTNDQIKELMKSIRIVFFTPGEATNTVLAVAKLDTVNATVGADGVTANMYIEKYVDAYIIPYTYKVNVTTTAKDGTSTPVVTEEERTGELVCFQLETTTTTGTVDNPETTSTYSYFVDYELETALSDEAFISAIQASLKNTNTDKETVEEEYVTGTLSYTAVDSTQKDQYTATTTPVRLDGKDAVITALPQNVATNVSALVYLDGESITNASVSATGTSSMTGKMNLQFSSSANLVPMEYAEHHSYTTPTKTVEIPAGTTTKTLDSVANASTWELEGAPGNWSNTGNVVNIPSDATAGTEVKVNVKDANGELIQIYKIKITEAATTTTTPAEPTT